MSWTAFDQITKGGSRTHGPAGRALQVRVDTENILGEGGPSFSILRVPLAIRLTPLETHHVVDVQLLEIGWQLRLSGYDETISVFRSPPFFLKTRGSKEPYEDVCQARMGFTPYQVHRIEECRRGGKLALRLFEPWAVLKVGYDLVCVTPSARSGIEFRISQSDWMESVLQPWKYGSYVLLELNLSDGPPAKILSKAYEHLKEAETHFNNGLCEEVLAAIHKAFESVAKKLKVKDPDRSAFQKLLKGKLDEDVRDRAAELMHRYCGFLQLGRHVPGERRVPIAHREAEFALCTAKSALVYLSKVLAKPKGD